MWYLLYTVQDEGCGCCETWHIIQERERDKERQTVRQRERERKKGKVWQGCTRRWDHWSGDVGRRYCGLAAAAGWCAHQTLPVYHYGSTGSCSLSGLLNRKLNESQLMMQKSLITQTLISATVNTFNIYTPHSAHIGVYFYFNIFLT